MEAYKVDKLMVEARKLAADYRKAMGKPLGISAEIAKFDAARLLNLKLQTSGVGGYDAVGLGEREGKLVLVKGRAIFDERKTGQRIGQFKLDQNWDLLMFVMMDENYEAVEIYQAEREDVADAINHSKTSNRSKRGAMSVAKFKIISRLVWTKEEGICNDEIRARSLPS